MTLHEVSTEPVERRLDRVGRKAAPHHALDGETGAIHRDALAAPQPLVGGADRELESAPVVGHLRNPAQRAYDAGKHSRRSKTSNVSGPNARRSTGIQRGASARGKSGTPGNAGTAPSPSHRGLCTQ